MQDITLHRHRKRVRSTAHENTRKHRFIAAVLGEMLADTRNPRHRRLKTDSLRHSHRCTLHRLTGQDDLTATQQDRLMRGRARRRVHRSSRSHHGRRSGRRRCRRRQRRRAHCRRDRRQQEGRAERRTSRCSRARRARRRSQRRVAPRSHTVTATRVRRTGGDRARGRGSKAHALTGRCGRRVRGCSRMHLPHHLQQCIKPGLDPLVSQRRRPMHLITQRGHALAHIPVHHTTAAGSDAGRRRGPTPRWRVWRQRTRVRGCRRRSRCGSHRGSATQTRHRHKGRRISHHNSLVRGARHGSAGTRRGPRGQRNVGRGRLCRHSHVVRSPAPWTHGAE